MGWNGSNGNSGLNANGNGGRASRPATPQTRKPNCSIKSLLALLIVVGLSATAYFLFIGRDKTVPVRSSKGKTPVAAIPSATNSAPSKAAQKRDLKAERQAAIEKAKREYVKKPGQMMLPDGQVLTFPPPKEGKPRKVYAYGRMYVCDHLGNFRDVTPRPLFHTAFEANFLGLAQEGKSYIPAFLTGLDEDKVRKMLEKNYTPIGDETEEEWASLKAYDEMRCAALAYMEQGGKFDDFVNEYATFDRKQRLAKATSLGQVMSLFRAGKIAEAKELAEAANVMMEKNGYKPIRFPVSAQRAFDALADKQ